jgi:predicted N-formylglutamate amidohydrolase
MRTAHRLRHRHCRSRPALADALDAMLIQQNYSRLVIDCNRPLDAATSILDISEHTPIPGNVGLSQGARAARAREIFWPYHQRIEAELDRSPTAARKCGFSDLRLSMSSRI